MICVTPGLRRPNGGDLITQGRIISSRHLCSRAPAAPGGSRTPGTRILHANHNEGDDQSSYCCVSIGWECGFSGDVAGCGWLVACDVRARVVRPGSVWFVFLRVVHFPAADGLGAATKELMAAQEQSITRRGEWAALLEASNCCYSMTFTVLTTTPGRACWEGGGGGI